MFEPSEDGPFREWGRSRDKISLLGGPLAELQGLETIGEKFLCGPREP